VTPTEIMQTIAKNLDPRVPLAIALTVAEKESTFDPTKRGAAGEWGLFQLLPATVQGDDIGYSGPLEDLLDPALNTQLATGYLALLYDRFGTWPLAITHWNGSGTAARNYATAVIQRLPSWDKFVTDNAAFFQKVAKAGGSAAIVIVAALVALLLLRGRSEERAA
jgi:soluble lytic murein transglycosylase-like protein